MSKYKMFLLLLFPPLFFGGCKKESFNDLSGGTSLTIVNAVVGSSTLITNFTPGAGGKEISDSLEWYSSALEINYGSAQEVSAYMGNTSLGLSTISDSMRLVWSGVLNLTMNGIFSLFVIGPDTLHVDTLFTMDSPPAHPVTDSSVGIRFVNVSPGSNPVSVDIRGNAYGSEVPSLPYKGVTSFKDYPANAEASSDVFEFRDAASGNLLGTYTVRGLNYGANGNNSTNTYRFKNVTLALEGPSTGGQSVVLIHNY